MHKIKLDKSKFYADYFWSISDGSEIREDIFVKTYLQNYFTKNRRKALVFRHRDIRR